MRRCVILTLEFNRIQATCLTASSAENDTVGRIFDNDFMLRRFINFKDLMRAELYTVQAAIAFIIVDRRIPVDFIPGHPHECFVTHRHPLLYILVQSGRF